MFKYYVFDLKMKFGALFLRHSHYMQVILIPLRPVLKLCLERTKIDVLEGYFFLYWNLSSCSLLWKIPFSVQVLPIWLVRTCKSVQLVWSLEIVNFKTFHCVCVEGGVGRCRCQVSPYACAVQYRAKILYIFLRLFLCISLLELCPITSSSLSRPKCQLSLLTQTFRLFDLEFLKLPSGIMPGWLECLFPSLRDHYLLLPLIQSLLIFASYSFVIMYGKSSSHKCPILAWPASFIVYMKNKLCKLYNSAI